MGGQRADLQACRRLRHCLELVEPAEIDQQIDQGGAQVEHRHQRLPAGDRGRGDAVARERRAGLGHGLGPDVVEGRGFHAPPFARRARSTASDTRRGVSGVSLKLAPMLRNASATALAITAGGAMAPPSPRPFTP